jgi:hypothetical protein
MLRKHSKHCTVRLHNTQAPSCTQVVDETDRLLRQSYQEWLPHVLSQLHTCSHFSHTWGASLSTCSHVAPSIANPLLASCTLDSRLVAFDHAVTWQQFQSVPHKVHVLAKRHVMRARVCTRSLMFTHDCAHLIFLIWQARSIRWSF